MRKETTKNSTKKRLDFSFFKKHRALAVSLVIIAVTVASFLVVNYGRYVKEIIQVYYLRTKNFYFNSDKLTITGKTYEINPWSGTVPYQIDINMNSLLNSLKGTNNNITYDIKCIADNKTICYFGSRGTTEIHDRTLPYETHVDSFVVTVELKDNVNVNDGESVQVRIVANATSPYEEELSATFKLVIGDYGVNYIIEDESGRLYLDSLVSNTLPAETIKVRLTIVNPNDFYFDMTNRILDSAISIDKTNDYITGITFLVEPKSSMMVRYYKRVTSANNTYKGDGTPVIRFERLAYP